jgi:Leu/Phe-tRNA-protein transferase
MIGKAQKSHGARSELNSAFGLEKVDRWNPIRTSSIQSRSHPKQFLVFTTMKRELRGKKFLSDLQHVFDKWVERCKNCITYQRRYLEKDRHCTSTKF